MIDRPGPWGTGPFELVEGYSSLDASRAVVRPDPLACVWLQDREDRTPSVRLRANPNYWDRSRGPFVREIEFRNDLPPDVALDRVCDADGEVDLLTELDPADADRVRASKHAKLLSTSAVRALFGVINREADGLPLHDRDARLALNLALNQSGFIARAMFAHAHPLAGLAPPPAVPMPARLPPRRHDPKWAAEVWQMATGGNTRPLRLAAVGNLRRAAEAVAADLRSALGVAVAVSVHVGADEQAVRRRLAEKAGPQEWDILLLLQGCQEADGAALELHRAVCDVTGEFRAGPPVAGFAELFDRLRGTISPAEQLLISGAMDALVRDEAVVLSVCAPHALYAANRHLTWEPCRTSLELAGCRVSRHHWSRR